MITIYGMPSCPDCAFVEKQIEGNDAYKMIDIGAHVKNLKAFLNAFTSGGSEKSDGMYQNSSGNIFGSWVARLNLDFKDWYLGLYADHYFEDHSSMFLLDYDGYGSGEEWNQKKQSRYFLYDLKDIMLGAELHLKRVPWMDHVVIEYMNTKYQSGPVYHDHTVHNSTPCGFQCFYLD